MNPTENESPDVTSVRKCADTSYAKYLHSKNVIQLHNVQEHQLLPLLNHELNHWAQQLYLTEQQLEQVQEQYNKELKNNRLPFLESIIGYDSIALESDSRVNRTSLRFYI